MKLGRRPGGSRRTKSDPVPLAVLSREKRARERRKGSERLLTASPPANRPRNTHKRQARVEVGVPRLADKKAPPPPSLGGRGSRLASSVAAVRSPHWGHQSGLWSEIGARATLDERARSAAQLGELREKRSVSPETRSRLDTGSISETIGQV
ncbi:unnamed protein product [Rangifer tarandus platyrhynchus]|uniref:Uncharacterized protein n=1 Tax=Rangifer tarandus platyrhynchus TaxID=3082113 RepID=A0ABN9A1C9_RANTA|nr:unnamed protein product [Rangifer tarandus platyrhynchus]